MLDNPYQTPQVDEPCGRALTSRPPVARVVFQWTLICGISAVPSFVWGYSLHSDAVHLQAMIAGILTFVVAYSLVELSEPFQKLYRRPLIRRTMVIGYGTRLAMSIVFPIGLVVDMFTGMLSVALIESSLAGQGDLEDLRQSGFLAVYLTTLLQGFFLNCILIGYMLVIFAVQSMWHSLRTPVAASPPALLTDGGRE